MVVSLSIMRRTHLRIYFPMSSTQGSNLINHVVDPNAETYLLIADHLSAIHHVGVGSHHIGVSHHLDSLIEDYRIDIADLRLLTNRRLLTDWPGGNPW